MMNRLHLRFTRRRITRVTSDMKTPKTPVEKAKRVIQKALAAGRVKVVDNKRKLREQGKRHNQGKHKPGKGRKL